MNIINEGLLKKFLGWLDKKYWDEESGTWNPDQSHEAYLSSAYDFGNSFTLSATLVIPLQQSGHKVSMVGAEGEVMEKYCNRASIGLDWLVVDDRYVIDLWSGSHEGTQIVYDIQSPEVAKMFPPRELWDVNPMSSEAAQAQVQTGARIFYEFVLPHQAVDDILGGMTER